ncbi:MAG: penicillin-binding protein 1B [Gammaproteobacteria bacterium]|jgi:penicillin-binding protein 1B|nr:penicillin-binding protein 1B [Gammaproteobacteria bacterium]
MGTKSTRKTRSKNRKTVAGKACPKPAATRPRRPYVKTLLVLLVIGLAYLAYLDVKIISKFEGRNWQLPARVYARPMELYEGMSLKPEQLLVELEMLNYNSDNSGTLQPGQFHRSYSRFVIVTRGFEYWDGEEHSQAIRLEIAGDKLVRLDDLITGESIPLVRFDPAYLTGIFPRHGEDRELVRLEEVPAELIAMLVLIEDRRFFQHIGVDFKSIARAFVANMKAGRTVQGGSTITQQLVKNLFLTPHQNLWRKANEAVMAVLLELHYSKQKILETYLNEVYLGQDQERAIHGFGLASLYYFGKPLQQLSLPETALLVGMLKGASYYNPVRNPERAKQRRDVVLAIVHEQGVLSDEQFRNLTDEVVETTRHVKRERYPAYLDLVKRQLQSTYDAEDLNSEGLRIFTAFDPYVQHQLENAVVKVMPQLGGSDTLQAAAIVVSPNNGEVLAVVGDRQPDYPGFNRALDIRRHIGSLIKPAIYLSALKQSSKYTLASIIDDSRLRILGDDKKIWQPENYDLKYHGNVLVYEALLNSYNIPAVRIGLDVGLGEIEKTIRQLGNQSPLPPHPSMTLGAVDMSPFDVASIYQTFAANGFHSPLRSVIAVLDKEGEALKRYPLDVAREVNPDVVALVNHTLLGIAQQGTARQLANDLEIKVAGKTGTSDDLRDSWFAGFSGDAVAVVWMGYDDNSSTGLTGSSGAMRIWSKLMSSISSKSFEVLMPDNVSMTWVDQKSGLLSGKGCENAIELPFIKGSEPVLKAECSEDAPSGWFRNLFGG